jgi:hypothetical protein
MMEASMELRSVPISGYEGTGDDPADDALVAFYRAFNEGDLEGLARTWMPGDQPSMDNPIGGIRRGWAAIADGYRRLFEGPARVRVEFTDYTSHGGDTFRLYVGRERGWCVTNENRLALRIRTSRLFIRSGDRFRQLHHHGSIEEPALLAEYQRIIFGSALTAPLEAAGATGSAAGAGPR